MKEKGFTLLELILVLSLASIASGIVVASLYRSNDRIQLKISAREVSAGLRYSRAHAVAERRPYVFVAGRTGYTIYTSERAQDGGVRPVQVVRKSFSEGVFLDKAIDGEVRIDFFPLGDSTGGQVRLESRKGARMSVKVEQITGRARVLDG